MSGALDVGQSAELVALRSLLITVLPSTVEVVLAQVNRVPEPKSTDFVLMTPLRRTRLATNVDSTEDTILVAAIAGSVLTATSVTGGALYVGAAVTGPSVAAGTTVTSFGSGTGGPGTYNVSGTQTVASQTMYAGSKKMLQPTEFVVQLDVHGPASADNAQIISTIFRDEYAVTFLDQVVAGLEPLYTTDPRQMAFVNAESEWENRWIFEATMQSNQTVSVPQQFADVVTTGFISVDVVYPP